MYNLEHYFQLEKIMCHSFFAKNFRAFKEIEIPKLNKVNLFLGKNSVGKTALLEALYLHLHSNKIKAIQNILVKKDEHLSDGDDYSSVGSVVRHLFHNHQLSNFDKEGVVFGEITKQGKPAKNKLTEIKTTIEDNDEVLEVVKNKDKNHVLLRDDFDDSYRRSRFMRRHRPRTMENNNLQFVYSSGSGDIVRMWDNIDLTDKQSKVIEALQIIEPNLEGIKFVEQNRSRDRAAKASINGEIVPFKSMGDGINRILYIILSMVNAQDGYLLIDEFENGLHYSVQEQVWEVVFTLAKSLNVQVFATTHSSDCIKAFGSQWKGDEKSATMYRINYKNRQHSVMPYNLANLNDALDTNTEVR
jgi:AAA15 family ATPase/GTPase